MLRNKDAQAILDYVLLLSIVVVVLFIMGIFIRNSISGKTRDAADVFGGGELYMPDYRPDKTIITE